jgi:hypothetical protein
MRSWFAGIALWSIASGANALEVWLASGERCNSCAIYERAAQARGYGRALQHAGQTIPILRIDKNLLAADVLDQLPAGEGPDSPFWEVTLTVLVMDVGRVVAAGNIAESADNNELRQPEDVMFPPEEPADGHPALGERDVYAQFFAEHWNLEYFVDVALGKRPKRSAARPVGLAAAAPAPLGPRNVILWGSAGTPLENALFIPARLGEIRASLEGAGLGALKYVTLYGHGPQVPGNDTSYLGEDGRTRFKRADVAADFAADAAGLDSALTAVLHGNEARTLLVQAGHSGPTGSPLWGHGLTLLPDDVLPIKRGGAGEMVMVSGACNSGMFARAVQCGFFAAHPDVEASGCQLSPAALEASDDYLRHFFRAASGAAPAQAASRRRSRELPTLFDAHWYASTRLEDHQISYTSTDALIDDYFAAHPERLPAQMSVAQIRAAAAALTPAEASAAQTLTAVLAADLAIPLTGHVEANKAADEKLDGATELPSAERNRILGLPYKLVLPMLARRAAYAALRVNDPDYALAASCERQSLRSFFGTGGE